MLSIIVLDHDRHDLTRSCIESLLRGKIPVDWELVLVDNGSADKLEAHVGEFRVRQPRLKFCRNNSNLSFARANNEAVALCLGERILFLNNDVVLSEGAAAAILETLERNSDAGVVGGKLLYPETGLVQHAGMVQMLWGFASNFGVGGRADDPRFCVERDVFAITGAMLCVRRRLFEDVGGFDEGFWYGYEDVDLCLKVRATGKRVVYNPAAEAVHHESATLNDHRKSRVFRNNYGLFRRKWGATLEAGEHALIQQLHSEGTRRVVIFGTGAAAEGLRDVLEANRISVVAFTCSPDHSHAGEFLGRPVVGLAQLSTLRFDRLAVGTQYYFEVEETLHRFVSPERVLLPAVG